MSDVVNNSNIDCLQGNTTDIYHPHLRFGWYRSYCPEGSQYYLNILEYLEYSKIFQNIPKYSRIFTLESCSRAVLYVVLLYWSNQLFSFIHVHQTIQLSNSIFKIHFWIFKLVDDGQKTCFIKTTTEPLTRQIGNLHAEYQHVYREPESWAVFCDISSHFLLSDMSNLSLSLDVLDKEHYSLSPKMPFWIMLLTFFATW